MRKSFIFCSVVLMFVFCSAVSRGEEDFSRKNDPCEWCDQLGMHEIMEDMKTTTKLITRKLMYKDWDMVNKTIVKLKALYNEIDSKSSVIPGDYLEFHEDFLRYLGRFQAACEKKDEKDAEFQFQRVKTACHHCHIRYVRRKQTDDGIALERLYKDQFKEWGDGKSYNSAK